MIYFVLAMALLFLRRFGVGMVRLCGEPKQVYIYNRASDVTETALNGIVAFIAIVLAVGSLGSHL